ncbi:hypothetical protein D3C72_1643680 [compost metagenome]
MGHHGPGAVVLQPALFANHAAVDQRQTQARGDALGDQRVVAVTLLAAPTVEADVGDGQAALGVLYKSRPAVAAPQVIGRNVPELDAPAETGAVEPASAGRRHHGHRLVLADGVGDGDDVGLHRSEVAGAIDVDADRPLHQGPCVRDAFQRHLIALGRGARRGAPGVSRPEGGESGLDQVASVHAPGK